MVDPKKVIAVTFVVRLPSEHVLSVRNCMIIKRYLGTNVRQLDGKCFVPSSKPNTNGMLWKPT
jgi:hypothetical protein